MPYEGGLIQVDTRSFIEWAIYMFGGYELGSVRLLVSFARPGWTCVDAGANIGTFTIPLANRVGTGGAVHAFEPHTRIRERLRGNLTLNGLHNVVVRDEALSSRQGRAVLYGSTTYNQGASSLMPSPDAGEPFECALTTVDAHAAVTGLDRIDLLKVDTEGADLAVLRGATATIASFRPCIYVEANVLGMRNFGEEPGELLEFLLGMGYRVWRDDAGEFDHSWHLARMGSCADLPQPSEMGRGLGWENWLAVHPAGVGNSEPVLR